MTAPLKTTPLHDLHLELGGKMVDFAGWSMPAQYPSGILTEHKNCRENAALFDVSHMGQLELRGEHVAKALESLCPSSFTPLKPGKARYSFLTTETGGIYDDLIVTNAGDHFFVVVNASMREQDIALLHAGLQGVDITERTDLALIALQGPKAEAILSALIPSAQDLMFMESLIDTSMGFDIRISRLGYTGEDGYEISLPSAQASDFAKRLLAHEDCTPAGLGARDSLRLESGLCLYGNDISQDHTPIEAGLIWVIQKKRREEGGFPGADVIQEQIANGTERKLVGIRPSGRAPARAGTIIQSEGRDVGVITSGTFGPTVGAPVAMGYIQSDLVAEGTQIDLIIRGKANPATVQKLPFITQNYKRK